MSGEGKGSSKVRAFMGQTPKNLKQKFFSVLGTSSEYKKQFISGISNKVCVTCYRRLMTNFHLIPHPYCAYFDYIRRTFSTETEEERREKKIFKIDN